MIIQLDPTIPLTTPRGAGFAHFLIDMGQEHHLLWVVFLNDSGECWTFKNPEIRLESNPTMGINCDREKARSLTSKTPKDGDRNHKGVQDLPSD